MREDSLRGVTSNPAIFEKAILGSTDYDEQIAELSENGLTAREIYDEIAILDVQLAADVLRPAGTSRTTTTASSRSRWSPGSRTTPKARCARRRSTGTAWIAPT